MPGSSTRKLLIDNRKARFEYEILETYSAGLALLGSEVKAIRAGRANLTDAFARIQAGEVLLYNMHISPLQTAGAFAHDPLRTRKLLLKRREINKLTGRVEEKGLTRCRSNFTSKAAGSSWTWAWRGAKSSTTSARTLKSARPSGIWSGRCAVSGLKWVQAPRTCTSAGQCRGSDRGRQPGPPYVR